MIRERKRRFFLNLKKILIRPTDFIIIPSENCELLYKKEPRIFAVSVKSSMSFTNSLQVFESIYSENKNCRFFVRSDLFRNAGYTLNELAHYFKELYHLDNILFDKELNSEILKIYE